MIMIVDSEISELDRMLESKQCYVNVLPEARQWLADKGFDPAMGARPLTRLVEEKLKKPLSREILFGKLKNGGRAVVSVVNDELAVTIPEDIINPVNV